MHMTVASTLPLPLVIQGGMGAGVSSWRLARAVSRAGQLGVVSGTGIDTILVRRLQDGDIGGHLRRAIAHFPLPEVGLEVLRRYFLPDGRPAGTPYRMLPMYRQLVSAFRERVTILANFVEVFLAKEGHDGPVGINLLTKIQLPNLASLYGAMLAGVDYVIMGAGIPREIPGVLDAFAEHRPASLKLDVVGLAPGESELVSFDPARHHPAPDAPLRRPRFIPVVSSTSLATTLARKSTGRVDGFVVEGPTAGGHNAPPRGELRLDERGQPIYGERDAVDLEKLRDLGLPFWLAGGMGSPDALREARAAGAAGIQVGTLFAWCEESGVAPALKERILGAVAAGEASVFTDPRASPTGFPFKVVELPGDRVRPERRRRICDLGYLRVPVRAAGGGLAYRCPAEPVDAYVAKGGDAADTEGRRCLCNGLMADIGLGQLRDDGTEEPPLLTSGDDLQAVARFLDDRRRYTAERVLEYLLS
ncbi:MAG TPA: nitronate monooxygenase [Gemmatimonadaceae bacterium]|nr:nitronate monooxygenase [Gemmatimonadaceae bacterium]